MSWIEWLESRRLASARPDETVRTAAERMSEADVGALVVLDDEELVGILSERDLVRRVLALDRDPGVTAVGDVCTREIRTISERGSVSDCARLMLEEGFRHLPVVAADGSPVGMISSRDFLRFVVEELERLIGKVYREQKLEQLTDPYAMVGGSR